MVSETSPPPNGYPSTRHFVEYCVCVPLVSCACNASTNEVQIRARGHEIPFREPSHTSKYWRAGYNIGEMSDQKQKGKKIHINPSSIVQVHTVYRYPWVAVSESLTHTFRSVKKSVSSATRHGSDTQQESGLGVWQTYFASRSK